MATEKRLIDANAFKVFLEGVRQDYIEENTFSSDFAANVIETVQDNYLELAPTVDAVEVVHGRWVIEKRHTVSQKPYMDDNYHAHATCSECGFCIHSENASFGYPKLNTTNYCPNCGADMRGDGNGGKN